MVGLHILSTIVVGAVVLSFAEHWIHHHVMHLRRFPAWVYRLAPDLQAQFHNHAVMHHGKYYKVFDHEPSEEGKYFNLRILPPDMLRLVAVFVPVVVALWLWLSPAAALTLVGLIVGHNVMWNAIHVQMHVPERAYWFRHTAWFHFLARHHFMHHRRASRNYNVVLPLADFVLGTATKPRLGDVREMLRLGYLEPRTEAGRRLVGSAPRGQRTSEIAQRPPPPVVAGAADATAD